MTRKLCAAGLNLALMGICACDPHRFVVDQADQMVCRSWPMEASEAVDILFVIDNSSSMLPNQAQLIRSFPRLVEALRVSRLGGDLPDIRVGVISTDLGAHDAQGDCQPYPGDGGRLRRLAGEGTVSAAQPWLAYNRGATNVTGPPGVSPMERFKRGFSSLASLGSMGCSYEQPLEAPRVQDQPRFPPPRRPAGGGLHLQRGRLLHQGPREVRLQGSARVRQHPPLLPPWCKMPMPHCRNMRCWSPRGVHQLRSADHGVAAEAGVRVHRLFSRAEEDS